MSLSSELIQSLMDYQQKSPVEMQDPAEITKHFAKMDKLHAFVQQYGLHVTAQELIKVDKKSCLKLVGFTEQQANASHEYFVKAMEELINTMTLNNIT